MTQHRNNHCVAFGRKLAYDYDSLKDACEDPNISDVFVACDIDHQNTIAATTGTHIIGIGMPSLDWSGASGGSMFQSAATHLIFENLNFAQSNYYYRIRPGDDAIMRNCHGPGASGSVRIHTGDRTLLERVSGFVCIYVEGYDNTIHDSKPMFLDIQYYSKDTHISDCEWDNSYAWAGLNINHHTSGDNNILFHNCIIKAGSSRSYTIGFLVTAPRTFKNIMFRGCVIYGQAGNPIVYIEDDSDLTLQDMWFVDTVFDTGTYALQVAGNNPTVSKVYFAHCVYNNLSAGEWSLGNGCSDFKSIDDGPLYRLVNAAGNVKFIDDIIGIDTALGGFNLTFPSLVIAAMAGHRFVIKDVTGNCAANNLVIVSAGAETFDGAPNYTLNANYQGVELTSDGTNLFVI